MTRPAAVEDAVVADAAVDDTLEVDIAASVGIGRKGFIDALVVCALKGLTDEVVIAVCPWKDLVDVAVVLRTVIVPMCCSTPRALTFRMITGIRVD